MSSKEKEQVLHQPNPRIAFSDVPLSSWPPKSDVKSVRVVQAFIDRIQQINPLLNCVVDERYNEALAEAAVADQLIASKHHTEQELEAKFPFLGVPFSTKDHNAVKGLLYTCGVYARKDTRADEDSESVALMRKAGAIPFVLTNVPELCLSFDSTNFVHGQTNNAFDTNRIPGGSSGGEGSLLTASGCPLGVGSDIGGSIRMPCMFSGIFGHKPTAGMVSTKGTFPDSRPPLSFMSTVGPMSRFAEDLLPSLKVLAGEKAIELRLDEPVDLSTLNVFYQLDNGGSLFTSNVDPDIRSAVQKAVEHLRRVCKPTPKRTQIPALRDAFTMWTNCIFAVDFGQLVPNVWWELLKAFVGQSTHTLQCIMMVIMGIFKTPTANNDYWNHQAEELKSKFATMLGSDGVFLYPTHPTVAPYHVEPLFRLSNITYTATFNVLGLPSTAVPLGLGSEGLPIGLQVVANHGEDRLCLAVARELEKAFGGWVEPGKKCA